MIALLVRSQNCPGGVTGCLNAAAGWVVAWCLAQFADLAPDLGGVGMAEILQDGQGPLPRGDGRGSVAGGGMAVAEAGERPGGQLRCACRAPAVRNVRTACR